MDFVRRILRDSRQRVVEGSTEFSGFETLLRDFLLTLNVRILPTAFESCRGYWALCPKGGKDGQLFMPGVTVEL